MFKFSRKGVTVAAVLDRRRMKKNGRYPVKIEVVWRRCQKYFRTGTDMTEEEWAKIPLRRRPDERTAEVEDRFSRVRNEVAGLLDSGIFSLRLLCERVGAKDGSDVLSALRSAMETCRREGRVNSYYRCRSTLNALWRYAGSSVIPFPSVTPEWLAGCERFWLSEGKSVTTVSIYMKTLKATVNEAVRDGRMKRAEYPFGRGGYMIPRGAVRKLALTKAQIRRLMEFSGEPELEEFRDLWIFSYLCNGINFKDMLFLKHSNVIDGEICFVRAKTEHAYGSRRIIRAVVRDEMRKIIERWGLLRREGEDSYIFRFASGTETEFDKAMLVRKVIVRCNAALGEISARLGIPKVTTYSARHSFATVLQREGVDISYISECLGHSSIGVTQTYLEGFTREDRWRNAALLTDFKEVESEGEV